MFAPYKSHANAYGSIQTETSVAAADPHTLVKMLFDGALESIASARGALQRGDVEAKGLAISRAVRIVEEGLRAGLNLREGGELAANLNSLYHYIIRQLTHANLRNDDAALGECHELISTVRQGWTSLNGAALQAA